ncbi:MAG: HAMP domain-containing histidine kinase [Thermoclostridium sp.]|nr:HAMP domain-containing histidine kinase [Thermoclostridium sp.]
MKGKISNQFLMNYLIAFVLSILAAFFALLLMSFAGNVIEKTLMKNIYPASQIIKDDYHQIDPLPVVENGGGIQIINARYEVVFSEGLNTLQTNKFTTQQFTDFLIHSKSLGIPWHYDILYNETENFWLIVTFPTSIRIDFSLVYNEAVLSKDMKKVSGALVAVFIFYLLVLAFFAFIFSKITSARITNPLRKLSEGTRRLREGDYSARVDLQMKNEFAELQNTFNTMAERIERETALRKQYEEDRRQMIMDISHDLKNPLASITGYAELCMKRAQSQEQAGYLETIHKNSLRASGLLAELFELSRVENPEFNLKPRKCDVGEFLRQACAELLPKLEQADFEYEFDIPDAPIFCLLDEEQMNRVFHNLADNALRYNPKGTRISISLCEKPGSVIILFKDNGIGIPAEMSENIFKPFARVDDSRNPETGGTGLGLSIAHKIIAKHGGSIALETDINRGCVFIISLPGI